MDTSITRSWRSIIARLQLRLFARGRIASVSPSAFAANVRQLFESTGWETEKMVVAEFKCKNENIAGLELFIMIDPFTPGMNHLVTYTILSKDAHRLTRAFKGKRITILAATRRTEADLTLLPINEHSPLIMIHWEDIPTLQNLKYFKEPWFETGESNPQWLLWIVERNGLLGRRRSAAEFSRGNRVAALRWAQRAIDADPEDALSVNHLAELYIKLGRLPDAVATFRRAIALAPHNQSYKFRFLELSKKVGSASEFLG